MLGGYFFEFDLILIFVRYTLFEMEKKGKVLGNIIEVFSKKLHARLIEKVNYWHENTFFYPNF